MGPGAGNSAPTQGSAERQRAGRPVYRAHFRQRPGRPAAASRPMSAACAGLLFRSLGPGAGSSPWCGPHRHPRQSKAGPWPCLEACQLRGPPGEGALGRGLVSRRAGGRGRTSSYRSSSLVRGSFSCATAGSTTSQRPAVMSATKPSRLSTVLSETWHSRWMAANDSGSEFSLQNCRMVLMTLRGRGPASGGTAVPGRCRPSQGPVLGCLSSDGLLKGTPAT